jgi:hypothetical protein
MEKSFAEGSNAIAYINAEPWTDRMRAHPGFQALLHRAGYQ